MNVELLNLLKKESDAIGPKIAAGTILSGLANGLVIVIINSAAQNYAELNFRFLILFVICIALYIVTKKYALTRTAVIARKAVFKSHTRIADKIRHSSLLSFEDIGSNRIYITLSENTEIIYEASRLMVSCGSAAVMLLLSFGYLGFLSTTALGLSVFLLLCGILVYLQNQRVIMEQLHGVAKKENQFFDTLNHFLNGFKEVKMNKKRSDDLYENYLEKISVETGEMKIKTDAKFISNHIFAQIFFYILIASIVFLMPQLSSTRPEEIVKIMAVILFIIGPLGVIVDGLPIIAKANVAVEKIRQLEDILDGCDDSRSTLPENPFRQKEKFNKISLKRCTFHYQDKENQKLFSVGPIDLAIKAGEILFIVGGNGSGKTTLLKLITGLYYPESGMLYFDDKTISMSNYEYYRNFFSVIFSDFHLFDRLYGMEEIDSDRINALLNKMELGEKTEFIEGKFSQLNLSTGQRKRLALIAALMEDRPIYVFDEVVAEQDPVFRKYFYEVLLKELKAQGKTIIAVSHDDRYFHAADRVLKMEYGQVMTDERGI